MAIELGKAYVQIIPSAKGISGSISDTLNGEASSAGSSAGKVLGMSLSTALKAAVAAAGIGKIISEALKAGGDLQQSFGGLDTIYEDAADAAKKYSKEAVKAGISSNTYAEQAVSFGAALKKAYGGDNLKAIEAANTAILDMADNAAKMGTPIESIQQAYQSFARGQYTLLDNLKLGYGGTKGEMERLLADAEKLTGVKYNIDNLGDVYDAIHVIQEDLHLTGVAAAEAEGTFTGSLASMKAAAENLMANLALGEDIGDSLAVLQTSFESFFNNNLLPMIGNIFSQVPTLISEAMGPALSGAFSGIADGLNFVAENSQTIVGTAVEFVTTLSDSIATNAPELLPAAADAILSTLTSLLDNVDKLTAAGETLLDGLIDGMINAEGVMAEKMPLLVTKMGEALIINAPKMLNMGKIFQGHFIDGMKEKIIEYAAGGGSIGDLIAPITEEIAAHRDELINSGRSVIAHITGGMSENFIMLFQVGGELIDKLAQKLGTDIAAKIPEEGKTVIVKFINEIRNRISEVINAAKEIINGVATGIKSGISNVVAAAAELVTKLKDKISNGGWIEAGKAIITGLISGVKSMGESFIQAIVSLCSGALDAIKKFFKISSPSKVMAQDVGRYIPEGIAMGIEQYSGAVTDAMADLKTEALDAAQMDINTSGDFSVSDNNAVLARMDLMISLMTKYFPELEKQIPEGYTFNAINRQLGTALV